MSWEERGYASGSGNNWQPGGAGGGARSWLGGFPAAGRAVKYIAIANVVMFVLCQATGGYDGAVYQWLAMQTDSVWHGEVWRLFTFTYLHSQGGPWHLIMNMIGLYFLGTPLERRWGSKPFFLFYTLGGFAAVSLYTLLSSIGWLTPFGSLVGASGGVLAVMGACAVLFPQIRLILLIFPVAIRTATVLFVVLYTFNLFSRGANAGGDACHLAGLAFGIYFGYRGHRFFGKLEQMRSKVRESAYRAKREEMLQQDHRVDSILNKVKEHGIQSLSAREKKDLAEATERQKTADRQHGF